MKISLNKNDLERYTISKLKNVYVCKAKNIDWKARGFKQKSQFIDEY